MIANQLKNRSFRSTLDYVLEKEEAEIIDSNMGGYNSRQLAKEFSAARRMRPKFQRACGHIILSIPHRDASHPQGEYHEHLDDEKYTEIAQRWLKGMEFLGDGLHKSQYVIARHQDTDHEHIHIIASRIRMDGSVVPDSWDYRRSEVIVRQLEKEFGLEQVPCSNEQVAQKVREIWEIDTTVGDTPERKLPLGDTPVGNCYRDRRAQTKKQKHHFSGKPPVTQLLADAIDAATQDKPTVTELIARLQQQDIAVHPSFSTQGKFKEAIAYSMNGVTVAGWKLGKAYSFPGLLQRRGVDYQPERDIAALKSAQLGLLVKFSAPHRKADDGFGNFDESNQQQVFENELNNFDEISQQQIFDNEFTHFDKSSQQQTFNDELNNFDKNNGDKNNKELFGNKLGVDGGNNQQQGNDNKAIANQIIDRQFVKDNQPTTAQEINHIQSGYANKIAPIIQIFWQLQKQPQYIEGNHYNITLEENILTLTRKGGEKIAVLSVDNSSPPQGFSLTESDVERFLDLQRILTQRIENQKQNKNRGIEY